MPFSARKSDCASNLFEMTDMHDRRCSYHGFRNQQSSATSDLIQSKTTSQPATAELKCEEKLLEPIVLMGGQ